MKDQETTETEVVFIPSTKSEAQKVALPLWKIRERMIEKIVGWVILGLIIWGIVYSFTHSMDRRCNDDLYDRCEDLWEQSRGLQ